MINEMENVSTNVTHTHFATSFITRQYIYILIMHVNTQQFAIDIWRITSRAIIIVILTVYNIVYNYNMI